MTKNTRGFTLVELIVIITLLTILGTLAFFAYQKYPITARNSQRITDIGNIQTGLELFFTQKGLYPIPSNNFPVTYSGATAWVQGSFGENTSQSIDSISHIPLDPLTKNEYIYSITHTQTEYQIGGIWENTSNITQTQALVEGNYNGKILKVSTENTDYILAVPSILTSDTNNITLQDIINHQSFVIDKYQNIPDTFVDNTYTSTGQFDFTPTNLVVYEGSIENLVDMSERESFAKNLQTAYRGTDLESVGEYAPLTSINTQDATQLVTNMIAHHQGGIFVDDIGIKNIQAFQTTRFPLSWENYHRYTLCNNNYLSFGSWANIVALDELGSMTAWGQNTYNKVSDTPSGSGYKNVFGNQDTFMALSENGSITAWGKNDYNVVTSTPNDSGYVSIISSNDAFTALKQDGTITAWGRSGYGGDGAPNDSGYVSITSTGDAFAALKDDGTITVWGDPSKGGTGGPSDNGYIFIAENQNAFAALKDDGTITVWGDPSKGGIGGPSDNGYISIAYGYGEAFAALKDDGTITAWGNSSSGGSGSPNDNGYVSITGRFKSFAALKNDGTIAAWGHGNWGGSGAPSGNGYIGIVSAGSAHIGIQSDGSLSAWGGSFYNLGPVSQTGSYTSVNGMDHTTRVHCTFQR
ncbi:prepilin-type N-terminal cleavage/methylation domain-containing protein [Candidatus Gracilibacteria bacterium]|nr:prepilin-type N-terminal cleavage/methylation domain-containing protein [Candidatus Gracilibacteria bacterium]